MFPLAHRCTIVTFSTQGSITDGFLMYCKHLLHEDTSAQVGHGHFSDAGLCIERWFKTLSWSIAEIIACTDRLTSNIRVFVHAMFIRRGTRHLLWLFWIVFRRKIHDCILFFIRPASRGRECKASITWTLSV